MKKTLLTLRFFCGISLFLFSNLLNGCSAELDPDIEALLDQNIFDLEAPVPVERTCFPTESILALLTPSLNPNEKPLINAVALLREDLYKKTTGPVTRRSLLDEPALMPDFFYNNYWSLSAELFYNYSPKVYFTENSPFIRDYIDLTNENIVNEVSNVEFIDVDLPGLLGLFSTIKLQQHRAGLMFGFARQTPRWLFSLRMPLYYLVEHFFLTEKERQRIENNPFFSTDDAGEGISARDEADKFGYKHLASDRVGIGDARLSMLAHAYHSECQDCWFGLQATIPTAKPFARALITGEFDPNERIPPFNLQHYFNVFFCANANEDVAKNVIKTELTDFLVSALDRLSTILVNPPLGNGKHFGVGPEFDFRYHFNDYFSMHTYTALQAFTPHNEVRFYLLDKTQQDFDRDWRDPLHAGENLALLNRLIVSTLFPVGIKTSVYPGVTFQINQALMYKNAHWDLKAGFDYWFQGREKLKPGLPIIPCNLPLNVKKAKRPAAQQGKLFLGAGYYDTWNNCIDWHATLNMDATIFNKGIGQNYTLGLRLGLEF